MERGGLESTLILEQYGVCVGGCFIASLSKYVLATKLGLSLEFLDLRLRLGRDGKVLILLQQGKQL